MDLDPRINAYFTRATPAQKFVGAALLSVLDKTGQTEKVLASFQKPEEIDWRRIVAGRQLLTINGKTAAQLAKEGCTPNQIREFREHLAKYGLKLAGDE